MLIATELNLSMGLAKAKEAILFASNLSQNLKLFDLERLIRWFVKSLET
jgi:hypothetical protein